MNNEQIIMNHRHPSPPPSEGVGGRWGACLGFLFFFLLPFASFAQLSAGSPDAVRPTQQLTGNPEYVYVFFDKPTAVLSAQDTSGQASTFTWRWLNPADTTFTEQKTESDVLSSSLTVTAAAAGGYQVQVKNAVRDTAFSCWVFFDNFKIDTVTFFNECNGLGLEMATTPKMRTGYTIYNFDEFLNSPSHTGDSTFTGWQEIRWEAGENIHEGVDDADESWKQRTNSYSTVINSPPPLKASNYSLTVKDVFGKSATYTTPYTVPAIAAYAKITAEEERKGQWENVENPLTGEALYRVRFSPEKSKNAQKYYWKGFGDASKNFGQLIMWSDSTTAATGWVMPRSPHKNEWVEGYVPGSYTVRLTVHNTASGCADSTEMSLTIDPSKFGADAIPNAFTPNGDGSNDIFRFVKGNEPQSMEYIQVYIFSRSGALVYRYEGRADEWQGWDGKRMGTGGEVADGVYYYVITGEGWDGVAYNSAEYKGSLHIFR